MCCVDRYTECYSPMPNPESVFATKLEMHQEREGTACRVFSLSLNAMLCLNHAEQWLSIPICLIGCISHPLGFVERLERIIRNLIHR